MHRLALGLVVLASLATTSCGFALRTESVGERLSGVHLSGSIARDVQIAIERQARVYAVPLIEEATADVQTISSIEEIEHQRSMGLDPLGRPIEYWISVRWDVTLESEPHTPLVLHASESIGLDEASLIGFEKEKARIFELLRKELALLLISRLALLNDASD